jgi:prephenate dehydratase
LIYSTTIMGTLVEANMNEENKYDQAMKFAPIENEDQSTKTALIFSLHEEVGALAKALNVFQSSLSSII